MEKITLAVDGKKITKSKNKNLVTLSLYGYDDVPGGVLI